MVHYMPWFVSPPVSKTYGWHWTMNHFKPELDPNLHTQGSHAPYVASHYYPLIGLYDSGDPHVLEYEALLMKVSGMDGAILDWYGTDNCDDYGLIDLNTQRFIDVLTKFDLKFAIMYEDRFVPRLIENHVTDTEHAVEHGHEIMRWVSKTWFSKPNYLRLDNKPVLFMYGPEYYKLEDVTKILDAIDPAPILITHIKPVGPALGAFAWPMPAGGTVRSAEKLAAFYVRAHEWKEFVPVIYPRFHDVYEDAHFGKSWGQIGDRNGKTLLETMLKAVSSGGRVVQIATWNDWNEGTQVEPSEEFGYRDLEALQSRYQLVSAGKGGTIYSARDLRLPKQIFDLRRKYTADKTMQSKLDKIAFYIVKGDVAQARKLLAELK